MKIKGLLAGSLLYEMVSNVVMVPDSAEFFLTSWIIAVTFPVYIKILKARCRRAIPLIPVMGLIENGV